MNFMYHFDCDFCREMNLITRFFSIWVTKNTQTFVRVLIRFKKENILLIIASVSFAFTTNTWVISFLFKRIICVSIIFNTICFI